VEEAAMTTMVRGTTDIEDVYAEFVSSHYVTAPLRTAHQFKAVIEAAGLRPREVTPEFWNRLRLEWVWGLSPQPFTGPESRRFNAEYRRNCELRGVTP
jgi:hypothetical protein